MAGGWIRLPECQPIDAMVAAAITDAWMPPVFSKVDAMIAVPTMIAGIYGMNFTHMPELEWAYGYYLSLAAMALAGVAPQEMRPVALVLNIAVSASLTAMASAP